MGTTKREYRPGSVLAGKYKLQKQLGRGASGMVWSAVNVTTSRQVALKVLLHPEPKASERLLREARAAGALKHPNVVDVYDVIVTDDGSPALVLEMLEGQTLQDLITERAPLPPAEAAGIARDVAKALAIAHASGIVHRDLKPANIFLHRPSDDPFVVKVVDFGISKNLLAGEGTLTETGMAVGSPSFMSPEQVRGERDIDGRADLWALGTILYEMLTGKRLFDGRAHEVLTLVLVQPIKPIEEIVIGVDPVLSRVVSSLLQRDLAKRLASADQVAEWLSTITTQAGARSQKPTEPPPPPSREVPDTTVMPVPEKKNAIPKIHDDPDDDEPTHVAPMAMRKLAKQTIPTVYSDDEEEEDRTRVAADAEMTAAIIATREPTGPSSDADGSQSDQNTIPTVRPPAPLDADAMGPRSERLGAGPRSERGGFRADKASLPPKSEKQPTLPPKAADKHSIPPKTDKASLPPKGSIPPKAGDKLSVPPKAGDKLSIPPKADKQWDPLESTCRHASLSIL